MPKTYWLSATLTVSAGLTLLLGPIQKLSAQPDRRQGERQAVHIVTLGDSITKGRRVGVEANETFAALIEGQLKAAGVPVRVTNVGIGGERTDQALRRLDKVIALKPDIVTVMYGTNDSYVDQGKSASRISLDAYRTNLEKIITELLRRGILPILMTEPRWADRANANGVGEHPNERLEEYVKACRAAAGVWRVPLVDHFAVWTDARDNGVTLHDWTTDACHPNPAGHLQLAHTLQPVLQTAIGPALKTQQKLLAREPVRVVCFGDSVTGVYYHTGSRRAYTDMLGIALRRIAGGQVETMNAGISGHTTANGLARIDADVLRHKPDLVTVMFGLNDMTRVSPAQYRANLKQIVAQCRAVGAEVVLATPNNVIDTSARPTDRLIQYCDVVREVGAELNVPVCDCYRELDAVRTHNRSDWRLLMSDEIHPNMDGHKRIAEQLTQTIAGQRISLSDVPPPERAIAHSLPLLREGKLVRVLAMPPLDQLIQPAIRQHFPNAKIETVPWPVAGRSLAEIEQDAKSRVRAMKPDLVMLAVPRSAEANSDEAFVRSYAWIMNWSLNFGPPTWDCVVVHPAVVEPNTDDRNLDDLIRRLVRAQDLSLIDREPADASDASDAIHTWWQTQSK